MEDLDDGYTLNESLMGYDDIYWRVHRYRLCKFYSQPCAIGCYVELCHFSLSTYFRLSLSALSLFFPSFAFLQFDKSAFINPASHKITFSKSIGSHLKTLQSWQFSLCFPYSMWTEQLLVLKEILPTEGNKIFEKSIFFLYHSVCHLSLSILFYSSRSSNGHRHKAHMEPFNAICFKNLQDLWAF